MAKKKIEVETESGDSLWTGLAASAEGAPSLELKWNKPVTRAAIDKALAKIEDDVERLTACPDPQTMRKRMR